MGVASVTLLLLVSNMPPLGPNGLSFDEMSLVTPGAHCRPPPLSVTGPARLLAELMTTTLPLPIVCATATGDRQVPASRIDVKTAALIRRRLPAILHSTMRISPLPPERRLIVAGPQPRVYGLIVSRLKFASHELLEL